MKAFVCGSFALCCVALLSTAPIFSYDSEDSATTTPDWSSWGLLGLGYSGLENLTDGKQYDGISVRYVFDACHKQGSRSTWGFWRANASPAWHEIYARFDILSHGASRTDQIYIFGFGWLVSLERNVYRSVMIPFFGLELGGIGGKSGSFQFNPQLGIALYSGPRFSWKVSAGYVLPTGDFSELRSANYSTGFTFML